MLKNPKMVFTSFLMVILLSSCLTTGDEVSRGDVDDYPAVRGQSDDKGVPDRAVVIDDDVENGGGDTLIDDDVEKPSGVKTTSKSVQRQANKDDSKNGTRTGAAGNENSAAQRKAAVKNVVKSDKQENPPSDNNSSKNSTYEERLSALENLSKRLNNIEPVDNRDNTVPKEREYKIAIQPDIKKEYADWMIKNNASDKEERTFESQNIVADENSELTISIDGAGFLIKEIEPFKSLKLLVRKNYDDRTVFSFKTNLSGDLYIDFVRYDEGSDSVYTRRYFVNVKPRELGGKKEVKKKEKTQKKAVKEKNQDYRKDLANGLFAQGNYEEAKKWFVDMLNEGKADYEVNYKMGVIENELGNAAEAGKYFMNNLNEDGNPFYDEALAFYSAILKNSKKYKEALDLLYKYGVLKDLSEKGMQSVRMGLADVYYMMGNFTEAAKEYKRFYSLYPGASDVPKVLFYLAYSMENYPKNPEFDEAKRIYNLIVDNYPESVYYKQAKNRILYIDRHYLKVN